MTSQSDVSGRAGRLRKLFNDVTNGKRKISTPADAQLFLEAVQNRQPPSLCIEIIISSSSGLEAVRSCVLADLTSAFIQYHTLKFIGYIYSWSSHNRQRFGAPLRSLSEEALRPFAWLVLELFLLPSKLGLDVLKDVHAIVKDGSLTQATSHETRELGYKIQKALQIRSCPSSTDLTNSPGGRHENDFADFREIAIYTTMDEFLATEKPFYRRAGEVFEVESAERTGIHLDNQFRLFREDMLGELRSDLQIASGRKKGRSFALKLGKLTPFSIETGDKNRGKKYLLVKSPPIVLLQFTDSQALSKDLLALRSVESVQFILVDTPVFAYEPVLNGLKDMVDLPLQEALLDPKSTNVSYHPVAGVRALVSKLRSVAEDETIGFRSNGVKMDQSQLDSLLNALTTPVSIIQGPPGTGKSFIGSQVVKWVHKLSDQKFLFISYTNYALDQFLEELLDVQIPSAEMVRLGSKFTPRTSPLLLFNQKGEYKRSKQSWAVIESLKADREDLVEELERVVADYRDFSISFDAVMEHLEFSSEDRHFFDAFCLPTESSGWKRVGRKGKKITVREIKPTDRKELLVRWTKAMIQDRVEAVQAITQKLDDIQERLDDLYNEDKVRILQSKRIIGCTTTAAAMYNKMIRAAKPDIVLVEEAGEILESHILTALAPTVRQLILIGDHKQLRPKINNYALTVEKGDGYDLNRSLFERLILQGHVHTALCKQHRMHPEISMIPRALTYPDLLDGPRTLERPVVDGLQDRVIFVHHGHPEVGVNEIIDRRDPTTNSSKQNDFEASMVLKCVRYLGQQGYKTDKMVVLTPYLGQLRLLRDLLREENDPVLNDLDAFDLIRAGLMTPAAAKVEKRPLRLSTIDNYQGEESDIVIASLTRSNDSGDIGFMAAPRAT
ncbi:hypothetical protein G7Y89_g6771 [Cudoniella acicularis]|uniref:NFX1-type zinc finger-containing protein 1 n=1 Tax=Cudoniella acicularis TaxID=354080 RepID=A0A8H4RKM5_9HELO|nr:hypothetical protein G7Y89_g6771 [Cudoniella acicularis]